MRAKLKLTGLIVLLASLVGAQTGPMGRAIKAQQVHLYPINTSNYLDWTSNHVLQPVIEDLDAGLTSVSERVDDLRGDVDDNYMRGTNIVGATYDPDTKSWEGLLKGTNLPNVAYDQDSKSWLNILTGSNYQYSVYDEATKLWAPRRFFFWAGLDFRLDPAIQNKATPWENYAGLGIDASKFINSGAAYSFNSLASRIDSANIYSDEFDAYAIGSGRLVIPFTGLYQVNLGVTIQGSSGVLAYKVYPGGATNFYAVNPPTQGGNNTIVLANESQVITTSWTGLAPLRAGDSLEFGFVPRLTLTGTHTTPGERQQFLTQFEIMFRWVGPYPKGKLDPSGFIHRGVLPSGYLGAD